MVKIFTILWTPAGTFIGRSHYRCYLLGVYRPGSEVIKLFVLNSAEHEIYPAHKC